MGSLYWPQWSCLSSICCVTHKPWINQRSLASCYKSIIFANCLCVRLDYRADWWWWWFVVIWSHRRFPLNQDLLQFHKLPFVYPLSMHHQHQHSFLIFPPSSSTSPSLTHRDYQIGKVTVRPEKDKAQESVRVWKKEDTEKCTAVGFSHVDVHSLTLASKQIFKLYRWQKCFDYHFANRLES